MCDIPEEMRRYFSWRKLEQELSFSTFTKTTPRSLVLYGLFGTDSEERFMCEAVTEFVIKRYIDDVRKEAHQWIITSIEETPPREGLSGNMNLIVNLTVVNCCKMICARKE